MKQHLTTRKYDFSNLEASFQGNIFHPKMTTHRVHTLMPFQTNMTDILLWYIKGDILKNVMVVLYIQSFYSMVVLHMIVDWGCQKMHHKV